MRVEGGRRREEGRSRWSGGNNVQRSTFNVQRSSHGRCKAGRWLCLLLLVALPVRAGEILGGRFKTVPDALYVNQAFEIHFELEVTFGSEVEDVRITDFPNNPELITAVFAASTLMTLTHERHDDATWGARVFAASASETEAEP